MLTSYIIQQVCQNWEIDIGVVALLLQLYFLVFFFISILCLLQDPIQVTTLQLVFISP